MEKLFIDSDAAAVFPVDVGGLKNDIGSRCFMKDEGSLTTDVKLASFWMLGSAVCAEFVVARKNGHFHFSSVAVSQDTPRHSCGVGGLGWA